MSAQQVHEKIPPARVRGRLHRLLMAHKEKMENPRALRRMAAITDDDKKMQLLRKSKELEMRNERRLARLRDRGVKKVQGRKTREAKKIKHTVKDPFANSVHSELGVILSSLQKTIRAIKEVEIQIKQDKRRMEAVRTFDEENPAIVRWSRAYDSFTELLKEELGRMRPSSPILRLEAAIGEVIAVKPKTRDELREKIIRTKNLCAWFKRLLASAAIAEIKDTVEYEIYVAEGSDKNWNRQISQCEKLTAKLTGQ